MPESLPDEKPLRILIGSTPKTGNTWLCALLSALYDLPKLGLVCPFNRRQADNLPMRWVAFHHFPPEGELLRWLEDNDIHLLTTVRHPADVLISLYHHLDNFSESALDQRKLRAMLHEPFDRGSIIPPAFHTFAGELECSLAWIRTGKARVVRYEDLSRNTIGTITELSREIEIVSVERLEAAVRRCELGQMRRLAGNHGKFFRAGAVGEWRQTLQPEIVADFESEPYRSMTAELGYSIESGVAEGTGDSQSRAGANYPSTFRNGERLVPIEIDLYLHAKSAAIAWPEIDVIGKDSFYYWMHQPYEIAGAADYDKLAICNLAFHIYRERPDLQQTFPDLRNKDRASFTQWLIRYGADEFGFDARFIGWMREEYVRWGNRRHSSDTERRAWWPSLSCFALHVYQTKPELQAAFPDVLNRDRWDFCEWLLRGDSGLFVVPGMLQPLRLQLRRMRRLRRILEWPSAALRR